MNDAMAFLRGMSLGAGLMYLLDPDRGNRRRALLRDKLVRAIHETREGLDKTGRDLSNRTYGIVAELTGALANEPVSDDVLVARVRTKLGRICSHPGAITVTANQGRVTLTGDILSGEVQDLVWCVQSVRGVRSVDNQLHVHEQAGGNPNLQGGRRRPGEQPDFLQSHWSPATRLIAIGLGGTLAGAGLQRGGLSGLTAGLIGAGLLLRAISNQGFTPLGSTENDRQNQSGQSQTAAAAATAQEDNVPRPVAEQHRTARQGEQR